MFGAVHLVAIDIALYISPCMVGNLLGNALDHALVAHTIGDQSGNRDDLDALPLGQVLQIREQSEGTVLF